MLRSAVPLRLSDGLRRVTLGVNVWLRSALGLCEGVRIVFDALRSLVPVRDFDLAVRVALRSGVKLIVGDFVLMRPGERVAVFDCSLLGDSLRERFLGNVLVRM